MALFIPSPQVGGSITTRQFVPGEYTANTAVSVTTTAIEILATSAASLRYATINTSGADIFIAYGTIPTTTDYDFKIPDGTQILDLPLNGQQLQAITASGTATVQIAVASAVAINVE